MADIVPAPPGSAAGPAAAGAIRRHPAPSSAVGAAQRSAQAPVDAAFGTRREHAPKLVQRSMGVAACVFNTREFFHGVAAAALRRVRRLPSYSRSCSLLALRALLLALLRTLLRALGGGTIA